MSVQDLYRLSPVQEGMLFHALQAGDAAPYFEQVVFRYGKELDLNRLESAWRGAVQRHSILRTAFFWEDVEEPVQVVQSDVEVPFAHEDWRRLPGAERERRLEAFLAADRARGVEFDRAPLLRLTTIHWSDESYRVVWSYHHLLLDARAVDLLLEEVAILYKAGGPAALPARRPFRDYIAWLHQQDLDAAEVYWRRAFAGLSPPAPLGIDRAPGSPEAGREHAEFELVLSETLSAALKGFARRHRLTLHTVIEGAWALALSRYSGDDVVVFGSTLSGRPTTLQQADAMIGCFINTLPVRVCVAPERDLDSWLTGLQNDHIELQRYQHSPLVEIRRWIGWPANRPLFEALLVFESFARGTVVQPDNDGRNWFARQLTNYPLTLVVWPYRTIKLEARFYKERFSTDALARLLAYLETVLAAFTSMPPGTPVRRGALGEPAGHLPGLPLLADSERQQVLVEWNDSEVPRPTGMLLYELVTAQARRTPDAPAVRFEDRGLTYRELELRSGRLASRLRRLGVGPDRPVGVLMERSVEMVVALLGTLRAGGAYLPLDPEQPGKRFAWMLADARIPVLVSQQRLLAALPPPAVPILCLEEGWEGEDEEEEAPITLPDEALAYVIYTSGSTGWPKGVMITHRGIVNRMLWMQETHGMTSSDRLLQKTPYTFDVSVWEFFWPLMTGACLVMARPGGHRDGAYLNEIAAREGVTVMHFVPSMLQAFLEEPDLSGCAGLRLVVSSGEALSPELRLRFRERLAARLENLYGPTEASVEVTAWDCRSPAWGGGVAIGRPVANTRILLLDRDGSPAPIGTAGELCIGGRQVARGYRNRPDLTAERFVPDPFGEEPGARLYRSGDLARHLPDGAIEYLGRIDHQVKIRGFRIEVGEIETVLACHHSVRAAVVTAREDGIDRRLVAYVVPGNGAVPEAAILRDHLRSRLPEYMLPADWVFLADFPRTASGKIDRLALPQPDGLEARAAFVPPRSGLERTIASLWQEVLGIERVGVYDNFFELGGHSLLMMRVKSRLQEQLGRKVSMVDLLSHAKVGSLARFLTDQGGIGEIPAQEEERIERQTERSEEGKARLRRLRGSGRPVTSEGEPW